MRKRNIVVIPIAVLVAVAVFSVPAMAGYSYDGFSMNTVLTGSVDGDVYRSCGDHCGVDDSPYTSNFSVPSRTRKWARLYVGVWGGNETYTGWVNTTLGGNALGNVTLGGSGDTNPTYDTTNPSVYVSGHGVYWVAYNCTDEVTMGAANQAVATTGKTSGNFDGRVYGIVLVVAYNDTDGCGHVMQYWLNEGNVNLNYVTPLDNTTAWFNGSVCTKMCSANLTTVHLCGHDLLGSPPQPENDYLYFNAHEAYHRPNQLGDDGNETWGDDDIADSSTGDAFDLHSFALSFSNGTLVNTAGNNNVTVWRGHDDDGDGTIERQPYSNEGEGYVHPCNALFTVNTTKAHLTRNFKGGANNLFSLPLTEKEDISTALSSIQSYYTKVYRYNSAAGTWEVYNKAKPYPPFSQFTTIDPGVGYMIKPSADCTLNWDC